jgi:hypothetical protein
MIARVTSGQVCRPHFHTPLHPWISADAKPPMVPHPAHHSHPAGPSWCSPFGTGKPSMSHHPSPPGMGVAHAPSASSHSSPHLFSFPPTPPKDATPDNVSGASAPGNAGPAPGSISGSAANDFGSTSSSSSSTNAIACSSVGSDTLSSSAASELKPYYVNAATHHNMITSLGSALSNCSSSKPREGTANFSSSINQSAHPYHSSSINPYYPAHYVPSSSGPPTSTSELSASSPYGFPHHSHHSASSLLSAKSIQSSGQNSSNKQRTKGRSSAGKRI